MLTGHAAIRDAYRDEGVAGTYVEQRFSQPLGALLHDRQARALRAILQSRSPARVLEIAPGPGRLTREVADLPGVRGTLIDASPQMLAHARRHVAPRAGGRWSCLIGDAFALPLVAEFDVVFTFRFLRHFEDADRMRLYGEIARVLKPGGLLVFDVVNEIVSERLRKRSAPGEYVHFDALLTAGTVQRELREAGFIIRSMEGVQRRYEVLRRLQVLVAPRSGALARAAMELVDRVGGGEPLEWIVTCSRA